MIQNFDNIGILIEDLNSFAFNLLKKDAQAGLSVIEKKVDTRSGDLLNMFAEDLPKEVFFQDLTNSKNAVYREVLNLAKKYLNQYPHLLHRAMYNGILENASVENLYLERTWINYQRPGEFIPIHRHSGILSFVIWTSIPYSFDKFFDNSTKKFSTSKTAVGKFEFIYTNSIGELINTQLPVDKSWEGKIMMFPAELFHQVYPFYEKDYRITVSGNIRIKA